MAFDNRYFDQIALAERIAEATYGTKVSVWQKGKALGKFGRNRTVGTSYETVAEFQGATAQETFVTTNIIDSISSSDAADTSKSFVIEGHTISTTGELPFVIQTATTDATDGRTKVALTTPLARATRIYLKASGTFASPQTTHAGTIYVYDDTDGITIGVPNTAAATKILLLPGETQSEKCSTSISDKDFWFIDRFNASIGNSGGGANRVTLRIETRRVSEGGAWRPTGSEIVLVVGQSAVEREFVPVLVVPSNSDVRVVAKSNLNTAEVSAQISGFLAIVRG